MLKQQPSRRTLTLYSVLQLSLLDILYLNQKDNETKHYLKVQGNPEVSQITKLTTHEHLVKSKTGLRAKEEQKYTLAEITGL